MNFLSNDNYKLLYEIVKENITTDIEIFNKVFNDFGNLNQNNTENYDLITYNKQFLTLLQSIIHNKPEVAAHKRKVTFDNKLEEHKQHFLSYIPKPPPTPDFVDKPDTTNIDPIDTLIQQTLLKRNYEPIAPVNKKPRKIQIQNQPIEQDTLTNEAILLDTTEDDPIANLFSKLQQHNTNTNSSGVQTNPNITTDEDINGYINTIQQNINNILDTFEKIKLLIRLKKITYK